MLANAVYLAALTLASPLIVYRLIRHGRYRRGIGNKLLGISRRRAAELRGAGDCVWIHAVSVGEVNLLAGLVRALEQQTPYPRVVVSSSTDSGYDLAVARFGKDRVFFCPLDFSWAVHRTLVNLDPQQLVLTELELWPNLVRGAARRGCPVRVINGRLSERSAASYQRFARFTRPIFGALDWVGCQDQACLQRFAACGARPDRLQVTGSMKFDDAPASRETSEVQACATWAGIDPWHRVWIVGSTQPGEEAMALEIYQSLRPSHGELRLILVPRHQQRFDEVARLIVSRGLNVHRRSTGRSLHREQWSQDTVILIDTIGELRHWWGVGQIATVGGSFGDRGGQNMLEPAGYGSAVSFGPDTRNFDEIARQLIAADGAVRVADQGELKQFVERCLTNIPAADSLGRAACRLIQQHLGATERTVQALTADRDGANRRAA